MTENKVTIRMDQNKLKEQLKKIMKIYVSCDSSRESISDKSDEYGNPSPEAESFYSDINNELRNVRLRHQWITDRMNRIIQINESGIGKRDKTTGVISIDVPESVDKKGISGFDAWGQGVLDSKTLVEYSEKGCTPEHYDALVARMKQYQDDPSYAAAVFDEIGPGRLLDLPLDIQSKFASSTSREAAGNTRDAKSELSTVLGHLLSTRSQSWDDNEAKNYADRLTHYAEEKNKGARIESLNAMLSASQEEDINDDGTRETIGLNYNDTFLVELANKLEHFKSSGFDSRATIPHEDSLEGVVHAMTGNPAAAIKWLVPDGPQNDPLQNEKATERVRRIRSLVSRRAVSDNTWTTDWAHIAERIDQGDGYALGNHEYRGSSGFFKQSAQAIAVSGILNEIGMGDKNKGTPAFVSDSARISIANILSNHPASVDDSAQAGNGKVPILETNPGIEGKTRWEPLFTDRALSNLVGQVSLNAKTSADLGEAMRKYHEQEFKEAVAAKDKGKINDIVEQQSQTNGFFAGAQGRTLVEIANNEDVKQRFKNNTVSYGVGLIPVAGGLGQLLMSHDDMTPFSVDNAAKAETASEANRQEMKRLNSDQLTLQMLNSKVYTDAEVKEAADKAMDKSNVSLVVDEEGKSKVSDLKPEDLAKVNSKGSSSGVGDGISRLGEKLHGDGIDIRSSSKTTFDDGFKIAKPGDDASPADAWR
jgi:hypothetical protein